MRLARLVLISSSLLWSLSWLSACDEAVPSEEANQPLSDLAILMEGAPSRDKLPQEPKSDATYPKQFDLLDLQSPVRDQKSRGVCSIFSTAALMEHLYIKEGSLRNPDFSEQFLQWSSKAELGAFTNTEGSNASRNIEAINRFGIVLESDWPYEASRWSSVHDERCVGDDKPLVCYTNGNPSEEVLAAKRWRLPAGKFLNSSPQSIKAYMFQNKEAVTVGFTFFYQAWNHGGSKLPIKSAYSRKGYILYPNAEDKKDSGERPAGHSVLIVGWDDELEVPKVDKDGQVILDEDGKEVTEKGFFLIKNSWGASSFGIENPMGGGYGWMSMRYVDEYGSVNASGVPSVDLGPEICDDGIDNNGNGLVDCQDSESCGNDPACDTAEHVWEDNYSAVIPDNDLAGLKKTLASDVDGTVESLFVEVNIEHRFIRDLKLVLASPSGKEVTLYEHEDRAGRRMRRRFQVPAMLGESALGDWSLTIIDNAKDDDGRINSWKLGMNVTDGQRVEICNDGIDNDFNGLIDCFDPACAEEPICVDSGGQDLVEISVGEFPIPDNDSRGVSDTITITGNGTIANVIVETDITHAHRGDLTLVLTHPDGSKAVLFDQQGGGARDLNSTFVTDAFNGKRALGEWTLTVIDNYEGGTGVFEGWYLEIEVQ